MIDLQTIFQYRVYNRDKLLAYGFSERDCGFVKEIPAMEDGFTVCVTVRKDNTVCYRVTERATAEEYTLVHVPSAGGSFVGEVRACCEAVLTEVAARCFDTDACKAEQAKLLLQAALDRYGAKPEFLWEKSPTFAVLRRADNRRWFAVLMTVEQSRFGLQGTGCVEIVDLKTEPGEVRALLEEPFVYPAYHMNKTHWYTVCLNGSMRDDRLLRLLSASYVCAADR